LFVLALARLCRLNKLSLDQSEQNPFYSVHSIHYLVHNFTSIPEEAHYSFISIKDLSAEPPERNIILEAAR
jgi:hypothetical protein